MSSSPVCSELPEESGALPGVWAMASPETSIAAMAIKDDLVMTFAIYVPIGLAVNSRGT
jgi:hypothetical protein